MLFHSSVQKELARSFGATLLVLLTIVVTMLLIRTMGQASNGNINPQEVTLILGYSVLGRMYLILIMALFLSMVSVLSRMYLESELVIWMSCGASLSDLLKPFYRFAWPICVGMATIMLVAWPWTNQQITQLKARFEQRGDLQRVAPGQFQASANGQRVFFIDKDSGSSAARQVFVSSTIDHIESTISAQSAQVKRDDNRQQLTLYHGQKLDRNTQTGIMTLSQFEQYDVEIGDKPLSDMDNAAPKNRWTWDLLQDRSRPAQAELGWRIGLVMCAINLVLLAVAMTSGNPRSGRSGNLALAIFTFLLYMNLINLSQTWVEHGRLSATASLIGLHGSIFAMGVLWLKKRQSNLQLKGIAKTLASRLRSAP